MIPANLSPLANHLWQSTLFTVAAWLLTLALRKNRAAIRYGLWLSASAKFLVPFSLLVEAGSQFAWHTSPAIGPVPLARAMEQISQPFALAAEAVPAATAAPSPSPVPVLLLTVWLGGFAISAAVWFGWWRRSRAAIRAARPLDLGLPIPVMTSPQSLEPGVFGVRKPILLLPQGIEQRLTPDQLQAVLAHELCHVRRRDNLTAAIHMMVESIFWFHPLVWWIGARLVEERERACDEEVVRLGNEPHVYVQGILNVCKFYGQSPLACASGVTGADLRKRIETIIANRISPSLTTARKVLLAAAGMAVVGAPVLIGLWHTPSGNAQSQQRLVFDVASIKRVNSDRPVSGDRLIFSPTPGGGIRGRLPVKVLITWAYRIDDAELSGGPPWISSDLYDVEARPEKFEGPEDPTARRSEQQENRIRERVKALLADRFRLVVRSETKDGPVYVLSVSRGGHKMTLDPEGRGGVRFGGDVIESTGAPISYLIPTLAAILGRPVLDETGLDGQFKYKMEFRPESSRFEEKLDVALPRQPVADDAPRPTIFIAIEGQLGLQLQSGKGPVTTVVIEHIERPLEN